MFWYQALILGAVQGLTEFLPISSSGHLIVIPSLFGWGIQPLVFDVILHLGTATALVVYFRNDLQRILKSLNKELSKEKKKAVKYEYDAKLGVFIVLGSFPAIFIGLFLGDLIEFYFRSVLVVALFLLAGSLLMFLAEHKIKNNIENGMFSELTGLRAFIIGLFQSLALFPGVSRSGATISGGMLLGLTREYSARFSFLLSIPIVLGAAILKVVESTNTELGDIGLVSILLGFLSSFIVGYLAIEVLLRFLKSHSLYVFILYRVVLAFLLIALSFNLISF